jgi:hypothetical protein
VLDSRQAQKLINKTQGKSREGDLQFDKIPHRQSRSPRSKTIEVNDEEEVLDLDIDEEEFKDVDGNESPPEEDEKKEEPLKQTVF